MDRTDHHRLEGFIEQVRRTFPDAEKTCTEGGCVQFAILLRMYAEAGTVMYDQIAGHAYLKLGEVGYDIRGRIAVNDHDVPLLDYDDGNIEEINKLFQLRA